MTPPTTSETRSLRRERDAPYVAAFAVWLRRHDALAGAHELARELEEEGASVLSELVAVTPPATEAGTGMVVERVRATLAAMATPCTRPGFSAGHPCGWCPSCIGAGDARDALRDAAPGLAADVIAREAQREAAERELDAVREELRALLFRGHHATGLRFAASVGRLRSIARGAPRVGDVSLMAEDARRVVVSLDELLGALDAAREAHAQRVRAIQVAVAAERTAAGAFCAASRDWSPGSPARLDAATIALAAKGMATDALLATAVPTSPPAASLGCAAITRLRVASGQEHSASVDPLDLRVLLRDYDAEHAACSRYWSKMAQAMDRIRTVTQALGAEVSAEGPLDLEEAARRVVARIESLAVQRAEAEAEADRLRAENTHLAELARSTAESLLERNRYRERALSHGRRLDWMQSITAAAMRQGLDACHRLRRQVAYLQGRLREESWDPQRQHNVRRVRESEARAKAAETALATARSETMETCVGVVAAHARWLREVGNAMDAGLMDDVVRAVRAGDATRARGPAEAQS